MTDTELLKQIPKTDKLMKNMEDRCVSLSFLKEAVVLSLDELRKNILSGSVKTIDFDEVERSVLLKYIELQKGSLVPVINATGVVVHTNLGRAPLPGNVIDEVKDILCTYSNLEYDIDSGKRGDRYHHTKEYIKMLTGAEDAVVVNNNASAVFLVLNTFAYGKEAVCSRGEMVEIGGSFRIPDVMEKSGAVLKEVGTTNKTKASDYEKAGEKKPALMMKVHKSNYEVVGFTEEAELSDIVAAAEKCGAVSYYDAGSGLIYRPFDEKICADQTVEEIMKTGVDIVSISGDKMLGGPQAGIIIGKAHLIKEIKKNQLLRMLRVDKLNLSVLQSVLRLYVEKKYDELPVVKMIQAGTQELEAKADKMLTALMSEKIKCEKAYIKGRVGGGSCPLAELDSVGVYVDVKGVESSELERRMRRGEPAVIVRVIDDRVLFDMRTIFENQIDVVVESVKKAVL